MPPRGAARAVSRGPPAPTFRPYKVHPHQGGSSPARDRLRPPRGAVRPWAGCALPPGQLSGRAGCLPAAPSRPQTPDADGPGSAPEPPRGDGRPRTGSVLLAVPRARPLPTTASPSTAHPGTPPRPGPRLAAHGRGPAQTHQPRAPSDATVHWPHSWTVSSENGFTEESVGATLRFPTEVC